MVFLSLQKADIKYSDQLRRLLDDVIREADSPALLFSAGLDTTVIAYTALQQRKITPISTLVIGHSEDEPFIKKAASFLNIQPLYLRFRPKDLLPILPETIRLLKSYDPMTIRNSVATHVGLIKAQEMGFDSVMTGDGADELFAGYHSQFKGTPEELGKSLKRLWSVMGFDTVSLGERMGIKVHTPFLHPSVQKFAETVPPEELLTIYKNERHGKVVIRRAFEKELPEALVWRKKCPAEFGSGTTCFNFFFDDYFSDNDYQKQVEQYKITDKIRIRTKEHLYYYQQYKKFYDSPRNEFKKNKFDRSCPDCGFPIINPNSNFCTLCGGWPIPESSQK